MNNTIKTTLTIMAILLLGGGLLGGGFLMGRNILFSNGYGGMMSGNGYGNMHGQGYGDMMDGNGYGNMHSQGYGDMMDGNGYGNMHSQGYDDMMGGNGYGNMHGQGFGDMMGGNGYGNMHGQGYGNGGMMGGNGYGNDNGWGNMHGQGWNNTSDVDPLTIEAAQQAVEDYIARTGLTNLEIGEIMIFANHAYAQIVESDSGIGALEVLIDPRTGYVSPEFGANMMWNLKYGMHGGYEIDQPMSITVEEAAGLAQSYLDSNGVNLTIDPQGDPFYGYYTFHTLKGEQIVGMLSVNGYSGDVLIHSWHDDFIEMEHGHE